MKEVQFSHAGATLAVGLGEKVTKDELYGEVRTIVEKDGRALERGYLLPDGMLLRRAQMSSISADGEGTPVENPQALVDEQVVEQQPSSFEKTEELRPVALSRLVGFNVADVYSIEASGLKPGLYETTFNYRKSYQPREALILVKDNGECWMLVGVVKSTAFVGKTLAYEFFDAAGDDDSSDPLDFSMM